MFQKSERICRNCSTMVLGIMRRRKCSEQLPVWIYQENRTGVADQVLAGCCLQLFHVSGTELPGQAVDILLRTGDTLEGFIEVLQISFKHIRRITLWIHRNKDDLYVCQSLRIFLQLFDHPGQGGECRRTDIRAIGVAEKNKAPLPFQALQIESLPVLVAQFECPQWFRLRTEHTLEFRREPSCPGASSRIPLPATGPRKGKSQAFHKVWAFFQTLVFRPLFLLTPLPDRPDQEGRHHKHINDHSNGEENRQISASIFDFHSFCT